MKPVQHPAIKELFQIIKTEDWSTFCPEKIREEHLNKWVRKWVVEVEFAQAVVNKSYLTSEYDDLIKFKLAQSLAEDLAEDCTIYKTENTKISAKMCAFRRVEKIRGQEN